jgi:hypothetical protein
VVDLTPLHIPPPSCDVRRHPQSSIPDHQIAESSGGGQGTLLMMVSRTFTMERTREVINFSSASTRVSPVIHSRGPRKVVAGDHILREQLFRLPPLTEAIAGGWGRCGVGG